MNLKRKNRSAREMVTKAIESSLLAACDSDEYGRSDNIKVIFDRETGAIGVYAEQWRSWKMVQKMKQHRWHFR